jgi:hypothetical protein
MANQKTTGELRKVVEITDDEINGAVYALLAKPDTGPYPISGGYLFDIAPAVAAHEPSRAALAKPGWRRTTARTVIPMGCPEKA